jgi:hypothetical protein
MNPNLYGSATSHNPARHSSLVVAGVRISGDCLLKLAVPFPIGTHLFLTETGAIVEDPNVFGTTPPEVQYLGVVIKDDFIIVTPKRLPVIL